MTAGTQVMSTSPISSFMQLRSFRRVQRSHGDDETFLSFQHTCPRGRLVNKDFKCSRTVKVSKYRHDRIKWHMSMNLFVCFEDVCKL